MSQFGLTDTGFVRKTQTEIVADKQADMRSIFGDTIDLTPQSPDGQMVERAALSEDLLWQIAELSYHATDPDRASGIALSALVKINGLTRQVAQATRVICQVTGTPGITIPAGQSVSNGVDIFANTQTNFTFDAGGLASVECELTQVGPILVSPNVLTVIDTPVTGWDTVDNATEGVTGRDRETDAELRIRRNRSTAATSQNQIESIIGAVGDIEGVTHLLVLENKTDVTDANGLTPHSFEVIAEGGDEDLIFQAIWDNQCGSIQSLGNTSGTATDSQGIEHIINFTRPTNVDIYVTATLTKRPDYPADGDDRIKQAIVDYADGSLIQGRGFEPSDDVIRSELYTPINTVEGHTITDLRIGLSPSPTGVADIPISLRQASRFTVANIEIV